MKALVSTAALFLLLFFKSSPLQAAPSESLDWQDFQSLEIQMLDDPFPLLERVKQLYPKISREREPVAWLRAVWIYGYVNGYDALISPELAFSAASQAAKLGLYVEWAEIRSSLIRSSDGGRASYEQTVQAFADLVTEARALGDDQALAYTLAGYAGSMVSYKNLDQGLGIIGEAQAQLNRSAQPSLLATDLVKNILALALRYQGQIEAALGVNQSMDDFYQKYRIHFARALNLYNMALAIQDREEEKGGNEAEAYFTRALKLATEVNYKPYMAMALYGLSSTKLKHKKYDEARTFGQRSLALFEEEKDENWMTVAHKQLAEVEVAAGRYQEALEHVARGNNIKIKADKKFQNSLNDIQYQAYLGLGDKDKALHYLQEYIKNYKQLAKEAEKAEYNRAAAKLGLQFETERNAALSEQVTLLKKFRIVSLVTFSLTLLVLAALFTVRRQALALRASRTKMKEVLDNIDEGILILDEHLRVLQGYSPYLDQIFDGTGKVLEGLSIHELLFKSETSTESTMMKAALEACIGQDSISWDMNAPHLPSEIHVGERLLHIHWQALIDRHNHIYSFLLSIRDITKERATEAAFLEQKMHVDSLQEKLSEILGNDIRAIRRLILKMETSWKDIEAMLFQNARVVGVYQRLHGWKGAARALGLRQLAHRIHAMESCLDLSTQSLKDVPAARDIWQSLTVDLHDYAHLLQNLVQTPAPHQAQSLFDFAALYTHEFTKRLQEHGLRVAGLSVQDNVGPWQPEALEAVHEMLLHALNNSLDHGFIRPAWTSPASIHMTSDLVKDSVVISVQDNGIGIDWQRVRAKAEKLGLPRSDQDPPQDLLFHEGFSTAEDSTETSGRGVGLSAIRALARNWEGSVAITGAPGQGTVLTITLPLAKVLVRDQEKVA